MHGPRPITACFMHDMSLMSRIFQPQKYKQEVVLESFFQLSGLKLFFQNIITSDGELKQIHSACSNTFMRKVNTICKTDHITSIETVYIEFCNSTLIIKFPLFQFSGLRKTSNKFFGNFDKQASKRVLKTY